MLPDALLPSVLPAFLSHIPWIVHRLHQALQAAHQGSRMQPVFLLILMQCVLFPSVAFQAVSSLLPV